MGHLLVYASQDVSSQIQRPITTLVTLKNVCRLCTFLLRNYKLYQVPTLSFSLNFYSGSFSSPHFANGQMNFNVGSVLEIIILLQSNCYALMAIFCLLLFCILYKLIFIAAFCTILFAFL